MEQRASSRRLLSVFFFFAIHQRGILIYSNGHSVITSRARFMRRTDSPLSPRQRKQASVKSLSGFQELAAEYQSSSSSTACNKNDRTRSRRSVVTVCVGLMQAGDEPPPHQTRTRERKRERGRDAKQCDPAASKQAKKKKRKRPPSFQVFISFFLRRLIVWFNPILVNNFHRMHLMFILYFLVTSEERDVEKKKKNK